MSVLMAYFLIGVGFGVLIASVFIIGNLTKDMVKLQEKILLDLEDFRFESKYKLQEVVDTLTREIE